ncbi:MAG: M81 family metallopeptidase [Anaerolineae bacterium]|nr:M81 family metallopeptidase [Anaerolineae bacterium]
MPPRRRQHGGALAQRLRLAEGALQGLEQAGYQVLPTLYATAMPGGLITRDAYHMLRTRLMDRLAEAMPVDGVLLILHGAMVADGEDDCEGDLLARVRALVGPECPVVSVLDMHGNLTATMVDAADALVAFNKHPHTDAFERGQEAAHLMTRLIDEGIQCTKAHISLPLLLSALTTATDRLPLCAVHEQAQAFRQDPRVANISVMGGFAYTDTAFAGVSVLATTMGDAALAQQIAQTLAAIAWEHREAATYTGIAADEAVRRAVAAPHHPVVLADVGDNVGGGSPGDGTVLLQALMEANAQDAVVVLADPGAVHHALQAGVGATIEMAVGGKHDHWHGERVQVRGRWNA